MFKALVLQNSDDRISAHLSELAQDSLPAGELLIEVEYSSLNYKDGMIIKGIGKLVREYPHVPGVDLAGKVLHSDDPAFGVGDSVVVTGYRVGETRWGGYAQLARVPSAFALHLPPTIDTRLAMAMGTPGVTSMMAVIALENHGLKPSDAEVLVTGAVGGVGSTAISILHHLGYRVAASTARMEESEYLYALGASTIVERHQLSEPSARPLESERWAGCIDAVGGTTLARVLSQLKRGSSVASVGLAAGGWFNASVMPFLLRGVNLLGIDSVMASMELRERVWQRLETELPRDNLEAMVVTATLDDLVDLSSEILEGRVKGRVVIKVKE